MSQVLKRLTIASNGDKSLVFKQSVYSWLHQWSLRSSQQLNECTVGVGVPRAIAGRGKRHLRMYHGFHRSPLVNGGSLHKALSPIENQRKMSILTDLLRRKKKYDEEETIPDPDTKTLALFDESPKELTEEEIDAKRNISRLNSHHQRLIHGQYPHIEPVAWFHHTVRYKQRMFGRYGESSGVNPGILWPTRNELKEKIEYEKICNPFTIQEMVEKKRALRQAEKEETERRIKEIEAKMALVDKFKQDLVKRQEAKERESNEALARREKLMEEVRRHFGYTVDPRDERFQELLAKKEKEQRKSLKEARKLEKQNKMLQKLEAKSSTEKVKSSKKSNVTDDDKDDD